MRELNVCEIEEVNGGLSPSAGGSLQLGLMGAALAIGSGGIAVFAFAAAIICYSLE
ncbi:hypothetical protein ACSLBF_18445 (plasmid) [Pseudoalteromonas sp. T1lg65]|uniref:hypothetical protein n=1 Tax=Pseudoalteromonas sp. T1lg65 TaxID=2077101 RepID=UPI003F7A9719